MRGTRTESGTTTNKDLDTGGYTAKTCEAIAATTGATQAPSEERSSPASRGTWVYENDLSRAIGCPIFIGRSIASDGSFQYEGGWAYLPPATGRKPTG